MCRCNPYARERFHSHSICRGEGPQDLAIVLPHILARPMRTIPEPHRRHTVRAWVFIRAHLQGLYAHVIPDQDPVLDIYGSNDWTHTLYGGPERPGADPQSTRLSQIIVPSDALSFEGTKRPAKSVTGSWMEIFAQE